MIALPLDWFFHPPPFWCDYGFQIRCTYPISEGIDPSAGPFPTEGPVVIVTGDSDNPSFDIEFLNDHGVDIGSEPIPLNSKLILSLALSDSI